MVRGHLVLHVAGSASEDGRYLGDLCPVVRRQLEQVAIQLVRVASSWMEPPFEKATYELLKEAMPDYG